MKDIRLERGIIGALMTRPRWADDLVGLCDPRDFAHPGLGSLWEIVAQIAEPEGAFDHAELRRRLDDRYPGVVTLVGGPAGIVACEAERPTTRGKAIAMAKMVRRMGDVRRFAEAASDVAEDARRAEDPIAYLDGAASRLGPLMQGHTEGPKMLRGRAHAIVEAALSGRDRGIPTKFSDIDRMTLGLGRAGLTILGARPSQGKSALALGIAYNVAASGIPVLFFSLEMPERQQVLRLACMLSGVPYWVARAGQATQAQRYDIGRAVATIERLPLAFDDESGLTIREVRVRTRAFHREHCRTPIGDQPTDMLGVIDYLQLVAADGRSHSREQDVSEISRGAKNLARELNVPILGLSQLTRSLENRATPRPRMADLRESGAIEQDADDVWMLWRPEKYDPKTKHVGKGEVIIDKQRNGPTGSVWLDFDGPSMRFSDGTGPTPDDDDPPAKTRPPLRPGRSIRPPAHDRTPPDNVPPPED